ncbi:MAG: hypothetical protein OEV59_01065 [Deltaproteobacteria bacterium]|nr:hypothetical protein [Deltaproteobacteria bacterium]
MLYGRFIELLLNLFIDSDHQRSEKAFDYLMTGIIIVAIILCIGFILLGLFILLTA